MCSFFTFFSFHTYNCKLIILFHSIGLDSQSDWLGERLIPMRKIIFYSLSILQIHAFFLFFFVNHAMININEFKWEWIVWWWARQIRAGVIRIVWQRWLFKCWSLKWVFVLQDVQFRQTSTKYCGLSCEWREW